MSRQPIAHPGHKTPGLEVSIFTFPCDAPSAQTIVELLECLSDRLKSKSGIDLHVRFVNGNKTFPLYWEIVEDFFEACRKIEVTGYAYALLHFRQMALVQGKFDLPSLKADLRLPKQTYEVLAESLLCLKRKHRVLEKPRGKHLFAVGDARALLGVGIHGETYAEAVAVVIRSYKEIVYHEFLHLLGLSEGYDPVSKRPLKGCSKCWMQFEPSMGTGLCDRHQVELRDCVKRMTMAS